MLQQQVLCTGKEKPIKGRLEVQKMPHKGNNYIYFERSINQLHLFAIWRPHACTHLEPKCLSLWPLDDNTSPWIIFFASFGLFAPKNNKSTPIDLFQIREIPIFEEILNEIFVTLCDMGSLQLASLTPLQAHTCNPYKDQSSQQAREINVR